MDPVTEWPGEGREHRGDEGLSSAVVLAIAAGAALLLAPVAADRTSLPDLEEARELLMIVGAAPAGGVLLGSAR